MTRRQRGIGRLIQHGSLLIEHRELKSGAGDGVVRRQEGRCFSNELSKKKGIKRKAKVDFLLQTICWNPFFLHPGACPILQPLSNVMTFTSYYYYYYLFSRATIPLPSSKKDISEIG